MGHVPLLSSLSRLCQPALALLHLLLKWVRCTDRWGLAETGRSAVCWSLPASDCVFACVCTCMYPCARTWKSAWVSYELMALCSWSHSTWNSDLERQNGRTSKPLEAGSTQSAESTCKLCASCKHLGELHSHGVKESHMTGCWVSSRAQLVCRKGPQTLQPCPPGPTACRQ